MQTKKQELMRFFKRNGGVARFSAILKAGFHSDSLSVLEKEGKIEKLACGLYRLTNDIFSFHPDLISVSLQVPKGVICLLSALSFHEATNEIPHCVDIAIPHGTHANRVKYPPVKFYRFSTKAWKAGIDEIKIENQKIKVYNLAKTIADCFKFRNRIGMNVARDALKVAIIEKNIKPKDIIQYAKICRVDNIIKPILEAIL